MNDVAARAATCARITHEQEMVAAILARHACEHPVATRAWFVGPHPDDNLIATGGVTLKYRAAGIPVRWVCLTDGRACVSPRAEREEMARRRPDEEEACARAAGVDDIQLLRVPEDELTRRSTQDEVVSQLTAALRDGRPDALFVPWWFDTHPLHRLTTHLAARALGEAAVPCMVYLWGLGSLPPASVYVDITAEFPRKAELMQHHQTQVNQRDYIGEMELLHRLQAAWSPVPMELAEAFCSMNAAEFVPRTLALQLDAPETLGCGPQPMLPPT